MLFWANRMHPDPTILQWCHFPTFISVGEGLGAFGFSLIVKGIGLGLERSKRGCPKVVFTQRKDIIWGNNDIFYSQYAQLRLVSMLMHMPYCQLE